ncbi:MAG: ArsR/SmtB family transcription factor [Christensenellales bacterium]|jgi:DNA-binding transcriptional ArsR family regulator
MPHSHKELLKKVQKYLPKDELLSDLSDLFKVFSDSTRIKILFALLESDMCVCAIADLLSMTQSAISHQLKTLRDANLVSGKRDGKMMIYSLADDHVRTIIGEGFHHLIEEREDLLYEEEQ